MRLDKTNRFAAPNFVFVEIFRHKEKILKYSKLPEEELLEIFEHLLSNIYFIPDTTLSVASLRQAYHLCKNVDEADTLFVALSIEYNAPFWTGDRN